MENTMGRIDLPPQHPVIMVTEEGRVLHQMIKDLIVVIELLTERIEKTEAGCSCSDKQPKVKKGGDNG